MLAIVAFILFIGTASAQLDFGGKISMKDLAQNEYVNIALVFLLVFSVVLFAIRDVFKRSYGAAVVIALVVGMMGALGVFYFYGPIIPAVAAWVIIAALIVIALILVRFFRQMRGLIWILAVLALIWFFVTRKNVCGVERWSHDLCLVIDFIAISILIIAVFYILFRLFRGWRPTRNAPDTAVLLMETTAGGTTNPSPGEHVYKKGARVRIVAIPQTADFSYWNLDGNRVGGAMQAIKLTKDITHAKAVFGAAPGPGPHPPGPPRGKAGRLHVASRVLLFNMGETEKLVNIQNLGDNPLQWNSKVWPREWIGVYPSGGSLRGHEIRKISVRINRVALARSPRKSGVVRFYKGQGKSDIFDVQVKAY